MIEYPSKVMNLTQGRYQGISHGIHNAYDEAFIDGSNNGVFVAPCDMVLKGVFDIGNGNTHYFQSAGHVRFRDGSVNFVQLKLIHQNSIKYKVGDVIKKGTFLYQEGINGNATGNHIHMEIIKGPYKGYAYGNVNIEDIFYVTNRTKIMNGNGYSFRTSNLSSTTPYDTIISFQHMNGNTYYSYVWSNTDKLTSTNNRVHEKQPFMCTFSSDRTFYLKRNGTKLTQVSGKFKKGEVIACNVVWRKK